MSAWSKSVKPVITGIPTSEIFMVDEAEAAVTPGITQSGWVRRTVNGSRKTYETLVAMADAATDAEYEAVLALAAGSFVASGVYKILTVGGTDFTLVGAADSSVGTVFTSTGTGTFASGVFVIGKSYTIVTAGTTDFTLVGAADSDVGTVFTATDVGSGTGTASQGTGTASQGTGTVVATGYDDDTEFPDA